MMSDDLKNLFTEKNKKVRIIWVELTPESRAALKTAVGDKWYFPNSNLSDTQSCHHVTVYYNPTDQELNRILAWAKIGEEIQLKTSKLCHNADIQAAVVSMITAHGEPIAVPNKIPHITISANTGIQPQRSNDMLKNPQHCWPLELDLVGTLQFVS